MRKTLQILFLVGDPDRVPVVSSYFDNIEFKTQKREIVTHTGTVKGRRVSVVSTGMGTDNIDIVLSELDAVANIDLKTKLLNLSISKLHLSEWAHQELCRKKFR